jgi:hypothetical protein
MIRDIVVNAITAIVVLFGTSLVFGEAGKEKPVTNNPSDLRIGWATRDVTPSGKVNLSGQFQMRITQEVKDPLTVTALAISSGTDSADSVIFVSCDTVTIPAFVIDECRKMIASRAKDFPVNNLVLNATHTHTAPDARPGIYNYKLLSENESKDLIGLEIYREFLIKKIADTAIESWNNRKEGSVAWGIGFAVVGHNRRAVYLKDFSERPDFKETPGAKIETNAAMYGNTNDPWFSHIEGYEDHSVQFLFTFDKNKQLTGSIINLACPSQETEGLSVVSADFWHEVRVALREKYGQDLFILPQCSAAGDQSPHLLLNKKAEDRRLKLKGVDSRQDIAGRIASAFDETLPWAKKDIQADVKVKHAVRNIDLAKRKVTRDEYQKNVEWAKQLKTGDDRLNSRCIARCQKVVDTYEDQQKNPIQVQPVEIHVIRLGNIVFATNPFELFLDYGIRIQAQSPATQTFLVQLAGRGIDWGGSYLPTERAEKGGGYSACVYCNRVGSQGGRQLVEATVNTIEDLFKIQPQDLAKGVSWPNEWTVFLPSKLNAPELSPDFLQNIPEQIKQKEETLTARKVVSKDGKFDFAPLFGGTRVGKTAYVYLDVESPISQETLLGFGADWWMEVWLNGERILDTTQKGNVAWPPFIGDHLVKVKLRQGKNILALRFISGSGSSVLVIGSPDALLVGKIFDCRDFVYTVKEADNDSSKKDSKQ